MRVGGGNICNEAAIITRSHNAIRNIVCAQLMVVNKCLTYLLFKGIGLETTIKCGIFD